MNKKIHLRRTLVDTGWRTLIGPWNRAIFFEMSVVDKYSITFNLSFNKFPTGSSITFFSMAIWAFFFFYFKHKFKVNFLFWILDVSQLSPVVPPADEAERIDESSESSRSRDNWISQSEKLDSSKAVLAGECDGPMVPHSGSDTIWSDSWAISLSWTEPLRFEV